MGLRGDAACVDAKKKHESTWGDADAHELLGSRGCGSRRSLPPRKYLCLCSLCPCAYTLSGKPAKEAAEIMQRKAAHVKANTEELTKAINGKRANLETINEVIGERAAEQRRGGGGGAPPRQ